jgi:ubiquinone/menaquinone biosynthesis C-methylase UbiE
MEWIIGIGIVVVAAIALYLLDREIYFYEGTHLGPRIQGWLYDHWAKKYDQGKQESQARDTEMLAQPLLKMLQKTPSPLVLDLATGTGRLPYALLREPDFRGRVIAVDVSVGMLEQAAKRLDVFGDQVALLRHFNFPLPFPDDSFGLVCCMEALEVMPDMEAPLHDLYRVLRPGGLLLTSRGTQASGRLAKVRTVEQFRQMMETIGYEQIEIIPWWRWFDRVTARKPGKFIPPKAQELTDVLKCPKCKETRLNADLLCQDCGAQLAKNQAGVILY